MGNDGGSIPTRRELVKEAARNPSTTQIKQSQQEQQEYLWTTDPISQKPLVPPIVSDCNGKLYNKDTILEYLVEGARKEDAEAATKDSVKGLKDVVEVRFEEDADAAQKASGSAPRQYWKCPVTGDRLGPGTKAIYIVPCGHAFSGNAIKEVSGEKCLTCDTEYASNDIIPIVPVTETDIARLNLRMKMLREKGLTHSLKKASGGKKRKQNDEAGENALQVIKISGTRNENGTAPKQTESKINNASTASLTAKVLQEHELAKKRKLENDNVRSLFSSRDQSKPHGRSADFMTRGYSLPSGAKG